MINNTEQQGPMESVTIVEASLKKAVNIFGTANLEKPTAQAVTITITLEVLLNIIYSGLSHTYRSSDHPLQINNMANLVERHVTEKHSQASR